MSGGQSESSERRGYIRIRERLVTFVKDPATGKVHRALTRDLGGVGVCLITNEPLEVGVAIEGELKLPDREAPVSFSAVVVWSQVIQKEPGETLDRPTREVGVKFVRIDPKDRVLIQQHAALNALPE